MPLTPKAFNRIGNHLKAMEDKLPGGKGDNTKLTDIPKEQLIKGVLVEYEHTDDFMTALEIAVDHLTESNKYYDYLADMEDKFTKDSILRVAETLSILAGEKPYTE